ncbi:hypothetical protein AB834_04895 [PVC group bacterium (ex Bugula neritina AB1)]|nr:hypothetical protein AB834_04895 [PVC group bacterium (ex Bugula neritina AB1)]
MKKYLILTSVLTSLVLQNSQSLWSHCEVPCGIFNDAARISSIRESVQTIEKAMKFIKDNNDTHKMIRWTITKEDHCKNIQQIVAQYFLHQRVKPVQPDKPVKFQKYQKELVILHNILIQAMKSKQTVDLSHTQKIISLLEDFEKSYFKDKDHKHLASHKEEKHSHDKDSNKGDNHHDHSSAGHHH